MIGGAIGRIARALMVLTVTLFVASLAAAMALGNQTLSHVALVLALATLPLWLFLAATLRARRSTIGRR